MAFYNGYMNPNYGYFQQQPYQMNQPGFNQMQPNFQQQQQFNNARAVRGRVIDNISEVMANEVSLDGSVSVFPVSDLSCIYAKAWTGDGSIKTFKFVPEPIESPELAPKEDISKLINERFDRMESLYTQAINALEHEPKQKFRQNKESGRNDEQHA